MLMAKQLRGDSIALTEGLLIAGWWLLGDGLALSGASRQLSQRESLAERPVLCINAPKTPSERGGLRAKREKIGFPLAKRGKTRYSIVTV